MGLKKMVLVAGLIGFTNIALATVPSSSADPKLSRNPVVREQQKSDVCPLLARKVASHEGRAIVPAQRATNDRSVSKSNDRSL